MQLPAGLECLNCRSNRFDCEGEHLECCECGATHPILGDVPVMFRDAMPMHGEELSLSTLRQLLQAFDLGTDPIDALRMRRIFARQARFGNIELQRESAQFLDRVRSTGHRIDGRMAESDVAALPESAEVPRYRWLLDYIPRVLPRATRLTANVRFRNTGLAVLAHRPPKAVQVCAFWFDEAGEKVEAPDVRTPLPVDILPGRELSVPIFVHTPDAVGRMQLQLTMVQEGVRFLHENAKRIPVRVREGDPPSLPDGWVVHEVRPGSYNEDHVRGQELLKNWLSDLGTPRPRILEIGGNASPMTAGLPECELYNLDVDLVGLRVGAIVQRRKGHTVALLCADAGDLPFPPGYFDAIVMFATLHHFPNPARLLGHLATRLRPGGFIGALCEPVGHIHPGAIDPLFLAELRKGVNEQSFTAPEWAGIFRRARLAVEEAIIDYNSLKARLVTFA